jgi:hypothetical protein
MFMVMLCSCSGCMNMKWAHNRFGFGHGLRHGHEHGHGHRNGQWKI